MNKRQVKKHFRRAVCVMPQGRRSKAGTWLKKETRLWERQILKAFGTGIRFMLFMLGVVMCMCDTNDITYQATVSLIGMSLMITVAIIQFRKETQWAKKT